MTYRVLLLPLDLENNQPSRQAIEAAMQLAQQHRAVLRVMTVLPGYGMPAVSGFFAQPDLRSVIEECYLRLESELNPWLAQYPIEIKTRVLEGVPHRMILSEAERLNVDLIVIPSHSHGRAERFFLGSVAARVVERATTSVLVVRPRG